MDFNQIRYFLALADTLNFTRAAQITHVSQSALTQAIRRLENELGGELIKRDGRRTELTLLGQSIQQHFEHLNKTRQLVVSTAQAFNDGEVSEINIGVICTIGPKLPTVFLKKFKKNHPLISCVLHDISQSSMANLLLSKSIDCAFCIAGDAQEPNIDCINLYHESMVVAFHNSHKFTMRDTLTISDMAEQPYIDQLNYEYRKTWLAFCKLENIKLNVVFSCEQEQWQQYLLKQGLGISLVPQYSIIDAEVNFKALANPSLTRTIALTSLDGGNCSKVVQVFLKEAAEHIWQGSEH